MTTGGRKESEGDGSITRRVRTEREVFLEMKTIRKYN
jgi:hypothetical protein